jgi:hypothetical protein
LIGSEGEPFDGFDRVGGGAAAEVEHHAGVGLGFAMATCGGLEEAGEGFGVVLRETESIVVAFSEAEESCRLAEVGAMGVALDSDGSGALDPAGCGEEFVEQVHEPKLAR